MSSDSQLQQFQADIKQFCELYKIEVRAAIKWVAFQLLQKIMERTPVDTGRARSGWALNKNAVGDHNPGPGIYPQTLPSWQEVLGKLGDLTDSDRIFIYNNVPYVIYLEEGTPRTQAHGMVRISLAEVEAEIDLLIAEAQNRGL